MKSYTVTIHLPADDCPNQGSLIGIVTPSGAVDQRIPVPRVTAEIKANPGGYAVDLIKRMYPAVERKVHGERMVEYFGLQSGAQVIVYMVDVDD